MPVFETIGGFNIWIGKDPGSTPRVLVYNEPIGMDGAWIGLGEAGGEPYVIDQSGFQEWEIRRVKMIIGARRARYLERWREINEPADRQD